MLAQMMLFAVAGMAVLASHSPQAVPDSEVLKPPVSLLYMLLS
jgi:hypothetical protein